MQEIKFYQILKDLEMMFTGSRLDDWQREQYFRNLGKYPEPLFHKAIDYLIANHSHRSVPLIGEIQETIFLIQSQESQPTLNEIETINGCEKCNFTGVVLEEYGKKKYTKAIPCECRRGQIFRRAWNRGKKDKINLPNDENLTEEIPF